MNPTLPCGVFLSRALAVLGGTLMNPTLPCGVFRLRACRLDLNYPYNSRVWVFRIASLCKLPEPCRGDFALLNGLNKQICSEILAVSHTYPKLFAR